jgi:rubredoxin
MSLRRKGPFTGKPLAPPPLVKTDDQTTNPMKRRLIFSKSDPRSLIPPKPETFVTPTQTMGENMLPENWRCDNCGCSSSDTSLVRNGPRGENTLCNACGLYYLKNLPIRT